MEYVWWETVRDGYGLEGKTVIGSWFEEQQSSNLVLVCVYMRWMMILPPSDFVDGKIEVVAVDAFYHQFIT